MQVLFLLVVASQTQAFAQTAPAQRNPREQTFIASTQPVAIPFTLTDTNHLLVRLKINGKGPFNFIVDTGAPVMVLRVSAAESLGLKPNARGFATLKQLEIEGGMMLQHVQCLVDTPYQIEGMNAIGASAVDLDGLLGYAVLARFRMQIDLTKDRMIWTPVNYSPPPYHLMRTAEREPADPQEGRLESVGGLLKMLGPLIKPDEVKPEYRGMIGIELKQIDGAVLADRVLTGSPAEKAGALAGDRIITVNTKAVRTISDAQNAMTDTLAGQPVTVILQRGSSTLTLHLTTAEGL